MPQLSEQADHSSQVALSRLQFLRWPGGEFSRRAEPSKGMDFLAGNRKVDDDFRYKFSGGGQGVKSTLNSWNIIKSPSPGIYTYI